MRACRADRFHPAPSPPGLKRHGSIDQPCQTVIHVWRRTEHGTRSTGQRPRPCVVAHRPPQQHGTQDSAPGHVWWRTDRLRSTEHRTAPPAMCGGAQTASAARNTEQRPRPCVVAHRPPQQHGTRNTGQRPRPCVVAHRPPQQHGTPDSAPGHVWWRTDRLSSTEHGTPDSAAGRCLWYPPVDDRFRHLPASWSAGPHR